MSYACVMKSLDHCEMFIFIEIFFLKINIFKQTSSEYPQRALP
jgi:hypothetical protein